MTASMSDTPPAFARLWQQMILERSGPERLRMGCAMFDASRALLRAGLRANGQIAPGIDERAEILRRTYPEIDPRIRDGALERLRHGPAPADPR